MQHVPAMRDRRLSDPGIRPTRYWSGRAFDSRQVPEPVSETIDMIVKMAAGTTRSHGMPLRKDNAARVHQNVVPIRPSQNSVRQ